MYVTGEWKDSLQQPVEMSQILTTLASSKVITIPSFACMITDLIGAEVGVGSELVAAGFVDEALISQNWIDPPADNNVREEENMMEVKPQVCLKVLTR